MPEDFSAFAEPLPDFSKQSEALPDFTKQAEPVSDLVPEPTVSPAQSPLRNIGRRILEAALPTLAGPLAPAVNAAQLLARTGPSDEQKQQEAVPVTDASGNVQQVYRPYGSVLEQQGPVRAAQMTLGRYLGSSGKTAKAAFQDAAMALGGQSGDMGGNLAAVSEQTRLNQPGREWYAKPVPYEQLSPYEREIADLPFWKRLSGNVAGGVAEMAGRLAAAPLARGLGRVGVPDKVAGATEAGIVFGTSEAGFDPKTAAVMAAFPVASKVGEMVGGKLGAKLGPLAQEALKLAGGFAASQTWMEATSLPEYAAAKTNEERAKILIEHFALNLVLHAPGVPKAISDARQTTLERQQARAVVRATLDDPAAMKQFGKVASSEQVVGSAVQDIYGPGSPAVRPPAAESPAPIITPFTGPTVSAAGAIPAGFVAPLDRQSIVLARKILNRRGVDPTVAETVLGQVGGQYPSETTEQYRARLNAVHDQLGFLVPTEANRYSAERSLREAGFSEPEVQRRIEKWKAENERLAQHNQQIAEQTKGPNPNAIPIESPTGQVLRPEVTRPGQGVGLPEVGARNPQPEVAPAAQTEVPAEPGKAPEVAPVPVVPPVVVEPKPVLVVEAGVKPKPAETKIGDEARIMGVDSVVAKTKTIGGVRYELFNGAKLKEQRASIRVMDVDSGNVVTLKQFPDYDAAEKAYNDAVAAEQPLPKPEPAPVEAKVKALKDPRAMTASEINKELDRLSKKSFNIVDQFIAAGRGLERPTDYQKKTDPLSVEARDVADKISDLRREIDARYGPNAPSRLPLRQGFGPREKAASFKSGTSDKPATKLDVGAVAVTPPTKRFSAGIAIKKSGATWQLIDAKTGKVVRGMDRATEALALDGARELHQMVSDMEADTGKASAVVMEPSRKPLSTEHATTVLDELRRSERIKVSIDYHVVDDPELRNSVGNIRRAYVTQIDGRWHIMVNVAAISTPAEMASSILHEWTHVGLHQVLGTDYTNRLVELSRRPDVQAALEERALTYGFATKDADGNLTWKSTDQADADRNRAFAMEEVIATASEEQLQAGPMTAFLNWVRDQFRAIAGKFTGQTWTDTDIRNLIRESRQYLANNSEAPTFQGGRSALVPTAESAVSALDVGRLKSDEELRTRAKGIMGQVRTIRETIDQYRDPAQDDAIRGAVDKLLGYDELFGAEQAAERVIDPRDFYHNQQEFSDHPIRHTFAAEAGMRWKIARDKLRSAITQNEALQAKITGPGHQRFVDQVEKKFDTAHELAMLQESFNADVSAAISNTKDIIQRRAYGRGQEDQYMGQLRSLESKQAYSEAVKSAVRDIVETISQDNMAARRFGIGEVDEGGTPEGRKVSTAEALTLLPGSPEFVQEILSTYRRLKPEGRPDDKIAQWAAETVQRAYEQARVLGSFVALKRDAKIRKAYDDLTLKIADEMARNPRATARKIIKAVTATATKAERSMGIWRTANRKMVALLRDMDVTQTAAEMAQSVLSDPAMQRYERDVLKAGGILDRPDAAIDQNPDNLEIGGPDGIVLPDGTKTGVIDVAGDPVIWESSVNKLTDAIGRMTDWINQNPDSTFVPYWTGLRNTLRDVYLGARVIAPEKLSQPFHQWGAWGMTRTFLDNLGTREGALAKIAVSNHERADGLAKAIVTEQKERLVNAVFLAAKSHDFLGGFWRNLASGRSKLQGIEMWKREIWNPLADSWQNEADGLVAGQKINGHTITDADMEAMHLISHDVIQRGFRSLLETLPKGREATAVPVYVSDTMADTGIKVVRTSVEVSRNTVTRRFNARAVQLINEFAGAAPARQATLLDLHFWNIVVPHLSDRANVYFDGRSRFEDAYRVISAETRERGLPLADRNMTWLVGRVEQLAASSLRPEELQPYVEAGIPEPVSALIHDTIVGEFGKMTKRLAGETKPEPSAVEVSTEAKDNQFTKSRKTKLAGSWLYDYGVTTTSELMGFAKAMTGFHYERVAASLRRVREDLEQVNQRLQDAMQREANRTGTTPVSVMGRVKKQNREDFRLGRTLDDFESNEFDIKQAAAIENYFTRVYGAGNNIDFGDTSKLKKLQGLAISNVLMQHLTATRNLVTAFAKDGRMLNQYQGTLVAGYWKAAWDFTWHGALPYGGKLATAAIKIPFYDLLYAGPKAALSSVQRREGKAAIGRFFEPMIHRLTQGDFETIRAYRDMADRGYAPRVSVFDDMLAKARLPSEGGAIKGGGQNIFPNRLVRIAFGGLELLDSLLAPLKSVLPGTSDKMINAAGLWSSGRVINNLELRLRKTFDTYRRAGVYRWDFDHPNSPQNRLEPEEALGRFMTLLPRTRNDLAKLNQLFEWYGGPDLQSVAMRFLGELRAGHQDATLLTPEEQMAFGGKWADDLNVGRASNRPLPFKLNDIPHQLMAALNGWNAQDFQQWVRFSSRALQDANFGRFALWAAMVPVVGAMLAAGAGTDVVQEEIVRPITKLLTGEDRATRQPWERQNNEGLGWALSAANQVPFVQTLVNLMLNDMPNKGVSDPQLFLVQKAKDVSRYLSGVIQTGDPTFGFNQVARSLLPASTIFLNRLPATEGSVDALNARRLLTRYGPQDLLQTKTSPSSANYTPLSPVIEQAFNAGVKGDDAGFAAARTAFIQRATELGRPDPEALFRQMLSARNPYTRAFRQQLTPEQRAETLARMTPDERATVERVEQNFGRAAGLAGSTASFQKAQPSGGGGPSRTVGRGGFARGRLGRSGRSRSFGRLGRRFGTLPRLARGRK